MRLSKNFTQPLYHGTSSKTKGESILNDGIIKAPDLNGRPNTFLRPILGRVYITPKLEFVMSYVLGANVAGSDHFEPGQFGNKEYQEEPWGYLFVIDEKELNDVQYDEDTVGELIFTLWRTKFKVSEDKQPFFKKPTVEEIHFLDWVKKHLHPKMFNKILEGEYNYWAKAGKMLLKIMPTNMKEWMMENLKSDSQEAYSNSGDLLFKEAWKFDKIKTKQLKRDGNNFFQLAERIK